MLKEIHEQPEALRQSLTGRITARRPDPGRRSSSRSSSAVRTATRVELVACGTASYAAMVGARRDPGAHGPARRG